MANAPSRRGDAAIVVALLLFILLWPAMWVLSAYVGDDVATESMDDRVSLVLLLALFCPPLWAGGLVTLIVKERIGA